MICELFFYTFLLHIIFNRKLLNRIYLRTNLTCEKMNPPMDFAAELRTYRQFESFLQIIVKQLKINIYPRFSTYLNSYTLVVAYHV